MRDVRRPPKRLERLFALFPALFAWSHFVWIGLGMTLRNPIWLVGGVLYLYLFPPLLWRAIRLRYPLEEGASFVGTREAGSSWIVAHRLQLFFIAFPIFERFLILVPGLFSAWLRLWGSRIGRRVYWTPGVEIVDRTHVEVGDGCFFGNRTYLSPHVVMRRRDRYLLYFKRIRFGTRCFVAFESRFGPGAEVADGVALSVGTNLYLNEKRESEDAPALAHATVDAE